MIRRISAAFLQAHWIWLTPNLYETGHQYVSEPDGASL
jgi:hypothetical protein